MDDIAKLRSIAERVAATGAEAIRHDLARRAITRQPAWPSRPAYPAAGRAVSMVDNAIATALCRYWGTAAAITTRLPPYDPGVNWVVEGIDGTANLAVGLPVHTVSVAAVRDGTTIAGAVAEPSAGRLWSAGRGLGAHLHDRRLSRSRLPLRTGSRTDLAQALVATTLSHDPHHRRRQARALARLVDFVGDLRILGAPALSLCWTAAGALDACYFPHSRHCLAATLIAREADVVAHLDAPDGLPGHRGFYAASPGVAGQLLHALITTGAAARPLTTPVVESRPAIARGEDHA